MNNKVVNRLNKSFKTLTVILLIIFLLLFLWDLRQFQFAVMRNISKNNQAIHNLQTELETVKSLNTNLVKLLATQKVKVDALQTNITEQLNTIEQPIIDNVARQTQTEQPQETVVEEGYTYLDFLPVEMMITVTSVLELARQMIMPRWSFS